MINDKPILDACRVVATQVQDEAGYAKLSKQIEQATKTDIIQ